MARKLLTAAQQKSRGKTWNETIQEMTAAPELAAEEIEYVIRPKVSFMLMRNTRGNGGSASVVVGEFTGPEMVRKTARALRSVDGGKLRIDDPDGLLPPVKARK